MVGTDAEMRRPAEGTRRGGTRVGDATAVVIERFS